MKILISYYSQTGNTEKIAKAMKEGLIEHEVDLLPVKEVEPSNLKLYDLVFLGSGIYASRVHKTLSDLIASAQELPPKFVFFDTHASKVGYQDGFKLVKEKIGDSSTIIAEFDCCGDNIGISEEIQKKMLERLPPEKRKEAEEHRKWLKGRPKEEELEKAKKFAQSIINKL
ncbi:MAG: flavodoxin family protein [Promethearchaeota archaeon]